MAKKPAPPLTPKPLPDIETKTNIPHNNVSKESFVIANNSKLKPTPTKTKK